MQIENIAKIGIVFHISMPFIPDDRISEVGKMFPDLMASTGFQLGFD